MNDARCTGSWIDTGVLHVICGNGNNSDVPEVLMVVNDRPEPGPDARPANLILIEQSGAKHEIPEPTAAEGMLEAQQAMRSSGRRLREIKLVSRHHALARWKAGDNGWLRVA